MERRSLSWESENSLNSIRRSEMSNTFSLRTFDKYSVPKANKRHRIAVFRKEDWYVYCYV